MEFCLFFTSIFICLNTYTTSSEIKIKYLVDDEIITNFDIEDEKIICYL